MFKEGQYVVLKKEHSEAAKVMLVDRHGIIPEETIGLLSSIDPIYNVANVFFRLKNNDLVNATVNMNKGDIEVTTPPAIPIVPPRPTPAKMVYGDMMGRGGKKARKSRKSGKVRKSRKLLRKSRRRVRR